MRENLVTTIQIACVVSLLSLWLGSRFIMARVSNKYFDIAFSVGYFMFLLLLWTISILGRGSLEFISCLVGGVTAFFGILLLYSFAIVEDVREGTSKLVSRSQIGKLYYVQIVVSVIIAGLLAWFYFLYPATDWISFGYSTFTGFGLAQLIMAIGQYSAEEAK